MQTPFAVEETLKLLAAGLVQQHRSCSKGNVLDVPGDLGRSFTPIALLKAQARISRLQIASGQHATADSLHRLVQDCTRPLQQWAPEVLWGEGAEWQELQLLDRETRSPTLECLGLADGGGNVSNMRENEWHRKLREALRLLPASAGDPAYIHFRAFVVRHALATTSELEDAVRVLEDLTFGRPLGLLLRDMYLPAQELEAGQWVGRCQHCGARVEDRMEGPRCSSSRCRERHAFKEEQRFPVGEVLFLKRELVLYWVEPGQEELRLYHLLKETRDDVTLYPRQDEVDIGVGGDHEIGIDLKDYSLIPVLARKFSAGLGELLLYQRPIIVVTDRGSPEQGRIRKRHLQELLSEMHLQVEVMTVDEAARTFRSKG